MLFLFQGCIGLSFKNWTDLQDLKDLQDRVFGLSWGLKSGQDCRITRFTG